MNSNPNDKPFEMKSQEPQDIGNGTPAAPPPAEPTRGVDYASMQPSTGARGDRTLWLTIGGITITACCVVALLIVSVIRSDPFQDLLTYGFPTYEMPTRAPTLSPRDLTATQSAWVRPDLFPSIASAEEAKRAVEEENTPYLEVFAFNTPYSFPEINQPGDLYIYEISLVPTMQTLWDYGWCTTTQEILEQNFAQMKVEFVVNERTVSERLLAVTEFQRADGGVCRGFTALITGWPVGQHQLETHITFLQPTHDGWNLYPAGTHSYKYFVNVE